MNRKGFSVLQLNNLRRRIADVEGRVCFRSFRVNRKDRLARLQRVDDGGQSLAVGVAGRVQVIGAVAEAIHKIRQDGIVRGQAGLDIAVPQGIDETGARIIRDLFFVIRQILSAEQRIVDEQETLRPRRAKFIVRMHVAQIEQRRGVLVCHGGICELLAKRPSGPRQNIDRDTVVFGGSMERREAVEICGRADQEIRIVMCQDVRCLLDQSMFAQRCRLPACERCSFEHERVHLSDAGCQHRQQRFADVTMIADVAAVEDAFAIGLDQISVRQERRMIDIEWRDLDVANLHVCGIIGHAMRSCRVLKNGQLLLVLASFCQTAKHAPAKVSHIQWDIVGDSLEQADMIGMIMREENGIETLFLEKRPDVVITDLRPAAFELAATIDQNTRVFRENFRGAAANLFRAAMDDDAKLHEAFPLWYG